MKSSMTGATFALLIIGGTAVAQAPATTPAPRQVDLTARYQRIADRIASIDAQATRVDDYNTLRNLQQMYGYYYDEALWDQVTDLFADDATLEVEPHGVYAGKASIRRYFHGLTGGRQGLVQGQLNNHIQLSPVITVSTDGMRAQARWRAVMQDGVFNQNANWGAGQFENEYVKQGGVWKIAKLHLYVRFYAPYEGGWLFRMDVTEPGAELIDAEAYASANN